jgi:Sortase domain
LSNKVWWAAVTATIALAGWGVWHLQPARLFAAGPPALPTPVLSAAAPVTPSAAPSAEAVPTLPASRPYRMVIKKISMSVLFEQIGLRKDARIQTPPYDKADKAFWYRDSAIPGQPGPMVVLGHVDTKDGIAAFFYLAKVRPGYEVEVIREDRSTVVYTVTSVEQFPKTDFPTERVYGPTEQPTLRLVTCGGKFNRATGHYVDNIIVFASMTGYRPAPTPNR